MEQLYLTITIVAAVAVALALLSDGLKGRIWLLSSPMAATLIGILVGPRVLNWLRPQEWPEPHNLLLQIARFSVAMAVMSIALRVPPTFWKRRAAELTFALTVGMFLMWATSALLVWWLLPVGFASALLIGAALTPTDPVIAGSITTGTAARKLVPSRIRYALAAESGANDGAAYIFVTLPLMALLAPDASWSHYLLDGVLRGVVLASAVGALVGLVVGGAQRMATRAGWAGYATLPSVTVALALLTLAALHLLGSDGILGVFVAGVVFDAVRDRATPRDQDEEHEQEQTQEVFNHLFSWPAFMVFGAILPWSAWEGHVSSLLLLAAAVLLLRRPPWFYFLTRPFGALHGRADRVFLAWFGPIGMAAIFYCLHAYEHHQPATWEFGSFVILASIVIHGMTATPGTQWYGRVAGEHERILEDS